MAKDLKMTENEMKEFVTANMEIVPKNQTKKFNALTLEEKVTKIQFYIDIQKLREDARIKNSVPNKVKELFDKRGTVEDAKEVLKFCSDFIDGFKQREIEKLDAEIARLQAMKQSIA